MWPLNPFASPLLVPTLTTVGAVLAAAFAALVVVERRRLREWRDLELFRRLATWTAIAPVYTLAVLSGPLGALLVVTAVVFQGLREYATLVGLPVPYRRVLLGMGLLAAPAALHSPTAFYSLPAVLLIVATLQPLLVKGTQTGVRELAFAALGWGYLPWLLGHFMLVHLYVPEGPGLLLAVGLAVALSDVAAFTVGKTLGRHPLAPRLSPKKTWEGLAGNLIGAALGLWLMRFALPDALPLWVTVVLPLVIAVGAVWGDLLESAMKREFQVKDAGRWLPGFGGLLDRVDSLIVATPLVYYFVRVVIRA